MAGLAAAGGSADNPFATGTEEAGKEIVQTAQQPATKASLPVFGPVDTSGISNPKIAEAVQNTDLNKAVATIPSILNGKKATMTPEQYDALLASIAARDVFSIIH